MPSLKRISVLIPTRRRLGRLKTLLESYESTAWGSSSELVFRVDDDDLDTQQFLAQQQCRVYQGPRYQGYRSMPRFFNQLVGVATGDVLMCGNDDMVFHTVSWPSLILRKANEFEDGIFNIGVTTYNEDHYPFSTVSRRVTDTLGFIWDPRIFWGDIFLRDVMGTLERTVKLPSVHIDHDWIGHVPDATFTEGDQNSIAQRDPTYWSGTHAVAVREAVGKLRGLLR